MRGSRMAALAAGTLLGALLAASPAGAQQQNQGGGFGSTLDQLNRTVNPQQYEEQERRARDAQGNRRSDDERRYEGSSGRDDRVGRDDRGGGAYQRLSDSDLRDEYRRVQRERRDVEDEMERRGIRR